MSNTLYSGKCSDTDRFRSHSDLNETISLISCVKGNVALLSEACCGIRCAISKKFLVDDGVSSGGGHAGEGEVKTASP